MMPAVMMPPVVVVAPVAGVADTARTIIGHDDAAAGIRVIGVTVVRVIIVIASGEEAPEVVPVVEPPLPEPDPDPPDPEPEPVLVPVPEPEPDVLPVPPPWWWPYR